jgi:hypothetical protein
MRRIYHVLYEGRPAGTGWASSRLQRDGERSTAGEELRGDFWWKRSPRVYDEYSAMKLAKRLERRGIMAMVEGKVLYGPRPKGMVSVRRAKRSKHARSR